MNTDAKKILLTSVVLSKSARKKFFFLQNFSTNQNSRKNQIPLFDFLLIGIERPMNTDTKKILLTFVVLSKFARKNFFFSSKFFDQSEFEKNEIPFILFFDSFDSRDQWTLMLKKFYWPLLYCRNQREKNFFFYKIFRPIRIREKIEFHYSIFYSLESRDQWTLILKKFYWPLLYCRNPREKIFFFPQNFSTNQNSRKMKFIYFDFLLVRFERPMNTDAKKILLTSVVLSKSTRKTFFFSSKFFDQSKFEKKSNSIIFFFTQNFSRDQSLNSRKNEIHLFDFFYFLLVRFERPMNTDAKKILLTSVVLSKSARKNFFFLQKFFDSLYKIFRSLKIREKIEFHYSIFYSLESRDQWTLILKKFYWPLLNCRNSREKIFFFKQNFSTNQNSRKMKFIYLIFFSFRSRDQWTLMLKKFYWPLLYCRNSREKIFFFKQNFSTNQNSRKMKFIYLIFFSFRSRDQWTLMLKKFYWPLLYCRNSREKIFFFTKIFGPIRIREKINFNFFTFSPLESTDQSTRMLKKILLTYVVLSKFARKKFFFVFSKFFNQSEFTEKSNSIIRFFARSIRVTSEHWY